jgi:hypothetical protein
MRSTSLLITAAGTAALLLAGCGTSTVDTKKLEGDLASQLAPQAGVSADDLKVECPDDQEAKKGTKFECEMTYKKQKRTIVVTLTSEDHYQATVAATTPKQ